MYLIQFLQTPILFSAFDVTIAYKQAFDWFSWATTCIWYHLLGNRRHKHFHQAQHSGC